MKHVFVLANPEAGRGRGASARDAAIARLRELDVRVTVRTGSSTAETRLFASEAVATRPDVLVIVGGDGTLAIVLDVLVGTGIPLVLVPAGTGNDLARALGIPFGSAESAAVAVSAAAHGVPRALDVGEAVCPDGTALFLTVAALGFDAKVSERTNTLRWPRGRARYYLAMIIELIRLKPMAFALRAEGVDSPLSHGTLIAVGNTRSYGGGMPVCPLADPHDGVFDVVHIAPVGRMKLIRLLPRLLRGTHVQLPEVTTLRAAEVEVSAPGLVVYADGERVGSESVRIVTLSGALQILLPPIDDDQADSATRKAHR
ncbi:MULTISPECIES: YegS/Rv2252/BmrU family lipid kinase [Microbacterium]|uniref:YegS/Rv2252/BmrU family lipid kinase n=1 Tax=Microbacterium profundi TaxID=450380 RepID=A0ABV3LET0_9MICO|nr:YegS/Rv2252/BmrU family lipid kinase [Microbacterium profundi]MCE7483185.1 YegS/Rv2252/BmrU family lipid kinase [Microbacterium profundi]